MASQTTGLLNGETTKRDVDNWMEDLLIRIQLRTMHPHDVIHHDGIRTGEEPQLLELPEISLSALLQE